MNPKDISFVFFGTPRFSTIILDELEKAGLVPKIIVAQEDKPSGRHLVITPPETKIWGQSRNIDIFQPKTLRDGTAFTYLKEKAPEKGWDVFVVAAYGKIIPREIIELPKYKTLNVHPSLLPLFRGPAPIHGAILDADQTGISIMQIDEELDHGPIVAQKSISTPGWPPYESDLEDLLTHEGGKLLAETIPLWINGLIQAKDQDHSIASFTKKVKKEDALINLNDSPEKNLRKIRAYSRWPKAFTFFETKHGEKRVQILKANIKDNNLILERVVPEGNSEMSFEDFSRGFL